jgi:uncharacterized membrane protein
MSFAYYAVVTVHVLAAFVWLGGMLFLGLVGAPALRAVEPPALRQRLFQDIGMRFRSVGWIAIAILVATGVGNLWYRGWLRELPRADFWRTGTGHALAAKLACVAVMITTSAVHDFALGPAAGRSKPGSPEAIRLRRLAALLARVNAIVGVLLVVAAVRLAR